MRGGERERERVTDSIYELNSSGLGSSSLETSAATNVGLRLTFPFRARICLKYRLCRPGIRHRGRINGCNRSLKSAVAILDENRESRSYRDPVHRSIERSTCVRRLSSIYAGIDPLSAALSQPWFFVSLRVFRLFWFVRSPHKCHGCNDKF